MSRQLEQKLQERFAVYLTGRGVLYCASAGGMRVSLGTAVKMKRAGYKKGFPDIFIYESRGGFHGMAIEVKCGTRTSLEQKWWQAELTKRGYYSIIVPAKLDFWKAEEFLEREVSTYLQLREDKR
jgi:hypothetical protein